MPVPTAITDLSTTAANNFPLGSDSPSVLDDVQRAHASFIAQLHAEKAPLASPTLTGTPTAPTAVAATNTTQLATTAHVYAERSNAATLTNKTHSTGSTWNGSAIGVAYGGTGAATLTANNVLLGNGTSALQAVAPGTSGNVLTSNGTTWESTPLVLSLTGVTQSAAPFYTAYGVGAGHIGVSTGNYNTATGYNALYSNTTGDSNIAIGHSTLYTNTTGNSNVAIGYNALKFNTTGGSNIAIGSSALFLNTTGNANTATGSYALYRNTTGVENTAVGESALKNNETGGYSTAIGAGALSLNTTGDSNTATGYYALRDNTTGNSNTATGSYALTANTTGKYNTATGYYALKASTTSDNNTAIGYYALQASTTGAGNTAIGTYAGLAITTGSNDTVIGYNAAASSATASNEITLGNSSIATLRCQVTTITSLSDARDKANVQPLDAGLEFVNALKPVRFTWAMRDGGKVGEADTGFIAQDLQAVQVDTGMPIPGLVYAENPEKLEAGYGKLLPVLVKAIQDLSAQVADLQQQISEIKNAA